MSNENSLQAVLERTATQTAQPDKPPAKPTKKPGRAARAKTAGPAADEPTTLVGAHLPVPFGRQLRIIAAEEGQDNKQLIAEALNLLFVKKNKAKIKI